MVGSEVGEDGEPAAVDTPAVTRRWMKNDGLGLLHHLPARGLHHDWYPVALHPDYSRGYRESLSLGVDTEVIVVTHD